MCGAEGQVVQAKIEGTMLSVCHKCTRFGQAMQPKSFSYAKKPAYYVPPVSKLLAQDYSTKIRRAREAKQLSQAQLANALAEKESMIHKLESGELRPTETLAAKLERFLGIELYKKSEQEPAVNIPKTKPSQGLTIGDLMKK